LESFLGGRRFNKDNGVKEAVTTWLAGLATSFYDAGKQNLMPRYDKNVNKGESYVKTQCKMTSE